MVYYTKHGMWITSFITGKFHYHNKSPHNYTGMYESICKIHRIDEYYYETKRKYTLDKIPDPTKICKDCLIFSKQTINIFDYIDDIEEAVNEIIPVIDFICRIPNIEVECLN